MPGQTSVDAAALAATRELRRSLLAYRSDAPLHELEDCATLATLAGEPAVNRILEHAIWARRVSGASVFVTAADSGDDPVHSALDQLRRLMAECPPPRVPIESGREPLESVQPIDDQTGDPSDIWTALRSALSGAADAFDPTEVERLFGDGLRSLGSESRQRLGDRVDAPVEAIASLVSRHVLRTFLARNADLVLPPYGSPALLWQVARLEPDGLGPFFAGLSRVVRGAQDVFGLTWSAMADRSPETLTRWTVLLAAHAHDGLLAGIIDLFADMGLVAGLDAMAERLRRLDDERDLHLRWRLRDAYIDLSLLDDASRVQREIAERALLDANEWVVLGELRGTALDQAGAEQALRRALDLEPHNIAAKERLDALRIGAFAPYRIARGFGSSIQQARSRRALVAGALDAVGP